MFNIFKVVSVRVNLPPAARQVLLSFYEMNFLYFVVHHQWSDTFKAKEKLKQATLMTKYNSCRRKEEPAILISRLLLRMRRTYVASIRLDFR